MSNDKEARVREILQRYGFAATMANVWKVQGTPVIYHKILEQIAIQLKLRWFNPEVIIAERDAAVIKAGAKMPVGDDFREEWAFGEAAIGVNYRVSEKQPAYVYAMAEKRARDRVTLRMLELSGTAETEDEQEGVRPEKEEDKPWLHPAQNTDSGFVKIMRRIHNAQSRDDIINYLADSAITSWIDGRGDRKEVETVLQFRDQRLEELTPQQPPAVDTDPKSLSNLRTLPTRIATMLASVPKAEKIEPALDGFLASIGVSYKDIPEDISKRIGSIVNQRIEFLNNGTLQRGS